MGQKPKTTVEINGKQYDAITGQPVTNTPAAPKNAQPNYADRPAEANANQSGSMSGVVKQPADNSEVIKPDAANSSAVHSGNRSGHTLNRNAAKPVTTPPEQNHNPAHDEQPEPARRQLAKKVDPARSQRSSRHSKSTAIAKFSAGQPAQTANPESEVAPALSPGTPNTTPAISPKEQLIAQQLAKTAANQPAPEPKPSLKKRISDKLKNGRTGSVMAASLAALLLIGYVTYLNVPRMALRVAAGRAGFSAELPGYSPSGFRFSGPVAYSPGELTLGYASNTDNRAYQVKEKETSWDSQTLLDNYVLSETELYSTYQQRGLTIYVFDGSTATWVNGGIWFTVSGDSQLTSEQLLKIAASL